MGDTHIALTRVARDAPIGAPLLLQIGQRQQRRWRRIYRALRDKEMRRHGVSRSTNFMCMLDDGSCALVAYPVGGVEALRARFYDDWLAAGTHVRAVLRTVAFCDGDVLCCRLEIIDLRPGHDTDRRLNPAAPAFYPPPPLPLHYGMLYPPGAEPPPAYKAAETPTAEPPPDYDAVEPPTATP